MKNAFILFSLILGLESSAYAAKIAIFVNEGFYPTEYFTPRRLFDEAGHISTVITRYPGLVHTSYNHQSKFPAVKSDLTFDQVKPSEYDMLVFVGGSGAWTDFFPNLKVHEILKEAFRNHQKLALICAATGVLGTAGNLSGDAISLIQGRNVTGYGEVSGILKNIGHANYSAGDLSKPYVVVDDNLITGRDPLSAELFGLTILNALK